MPHALKHRCTHPAICPQLHCRSQRAVKRYDIFKLFFTKSLLQLLVANTDAYAAYKEAGVTERRWKNVTEEKINCFIAVVITMEVHKSPVDP